MLRGCQIKSDILFLLLMKAIVISEKIEHK